jgi:hypothetical protein
VDDELVATTDAVKNVIPADILVKVERLRPILKVQGVVLRRDDGGPNPRYRLRYRQHDEERGYTVHKALTLGTDPAVAKAVAEVLQCWRSEPNPLQLDLLREEQARRTELHRQRQRRNAVRAAVAAHGRGERVLRRAMRMLRNAAADGPSEVWCFAQSGDFLRRKRTGRPRKLPW